MKNNIQKQKNILGKTFFNTLQRMALSPDEKSHIRQRIFDTVTPTTIESETEIAPILPKPPQISLITVNDRREAVRIHRDRRQSARNNKDRRQSVRINRDRRHYYRGLLAITSIKRLHTYNLMVLRSIQRLKVR